MLDKSFNDILREERKLKQLVSLRDDFYEKAALKIFELEEEKKKIENIYSTKYAIIEDEIKSSRKALDGIIERRTAKIIKEASLRASSKQNENQEIAFLTKEETRFYNSLFEIMSGWREELIDQIFLPPKEKKIEKIENTVNFLNCKKNISKDYIVVRLLKDIPTFVGIDGRNYTLTKGDVAVISAVNAKTLINRKAAVQILIKGDYYENTSKI